MDGEKYISMFKINGIPILPPLMTAARRREMLAYKELAMALETRLRLEAKDRNGTVKQPTTDLDSSMTTIEDEYLKVSSLLQDHFSPAKLDTPAVRRHRVAGLENPIEFLKKSDTFIYDINTNTVMIPTDKEVLVGCGDGGQSVRSDSNTKFSNVCQVVGNSGQSTKIAARKSPVVSPKVSKMIATIQPACSMAAAKCSLTEIKAVSSHDKMGHSEDCKTPPRNDIESKRRTVRATTSPALKDTSRTPPKLVRSNSFTLESPSPVLLEHMVRNRGKKFDNSENFLVNSPKELQKRFKPFGIETTSALRINSLPPRRPQSAIYRTSTAPTGSYGGGGGGGGVGPTVISPSPPESGKIGTLLVTNSSVFKNHKSPYEIKVTTKPKTQKKHKAPVKKVSSITIKPRLSHHRSRVLVAACPPKPLPRKHIPAPVTPPTPEPIAVLTEQQLREIEEQHRLKLMELMQRQQEEQRQMQEQFERQQKQLLEEFNAGIQSLRAPSVTSTDPPSPQPPDDLNNNNDDDKNDNNLISESSQASLLDDAANYDMTETLVEPANLKATPRCNRRLFDNCSSSGGGGTGAKPPPPTPRRRSLPKIAPIFCGPNSPSRRKEKAASILNAYVRGYLVRRLFRTEHVQQIVKTIQDTLLFAIKFHRETRDDLSKESIMFKARLLQQLTSACQSLQAVFNLPARERMQIVGRDRIYQQTKAKAREKYINYKSSPTHKIPM